MLGLTLRVRSSGSRTFVFYYRFNGQQKRIKLGDHSTMTLEEARKAARKHRVALDHDDDPAIARATKRASSGLTLGGVIEDYLSARGPSLKARSLEGTTLYLRTHWKPLHGLALGSITRQIVAAELREIAKKRGPVAANRSRNALSAIFSWAIGEGLAEGNPVSGTNLNAETVRERVLSDAELVKIWLAAPDSDYGRIVKLLMLTGQRRWEIGSLLWSEVDMDKAVISLPGTRTKNSRPHDIPLSESALSVLKEQPALLGKEAVFGEGKTAGFLGWSTAKARLDETCGVKDWALHDLRRTAATRMADIGVLPHVIEAVLNHISGHKSGVAGIYNRASYATEKRAALDAWASHLQVEIAKAQGSNITALRKKAKA